MSLPITREELARTRQLAPAPELPNLRQSVETRHFDLPVALHAGFFGLFLVYLAVMFIGLYSPGLIVPMAIFVVFTAGFYIVPALWSGMTPQHTDGSMSLQALLAKGIETHTGWCAGRDAMVQVLLIPTLILGWGIAVVSIAALV